MARSHAVARCAGPSGRSSHHALRPVQMAKRIEAFFAEVLHESLADGLVELCPGRGGEGPGYRLTPAGREWLLDFPPAMLDCAPRTRSTSPPARRPPSPPRDGGPPTS